MGLLRLEELFLEIEGETGYQELYDADPNCEHKIEAQFSGGIKCVKCGGWFCF